MKSVLVIEDDIEISNVFDRIVKSIDDSIDFDWCSSAEEAIERVNESARKGKQEYDLIIADFYLDGEKNGLDLFSVCKEKGMKSKMIVTSSAEKSKFLPILKKMGISLTFIRKPLVVEECRSILKEALFAK